ncbi:MAG: adenosylmethionine--8-amino-7-oxononanoate transaminase [Gammaproteobacteria bacterium]
MPNIWLPYTQMLNAPPPLKVASASGSEITLEDGRVLVDAIGSWWTSCHGYQHPKLVAAIKQQADTLSHVMLGGLIHHPLIEFTQKLCSQLPADLQHVNFAESGSVAVEIAMKIAYQYWLNQNQKRHRMIHLKQGYHGDTFLAMSVCDPEEGMHTQLGDLLPHQICIELPNTESDFDALDTLLSQRHQEIAAFIVEPLVQGAGGMRFLEASLLRRTCELMRAYQLPVIFDEIFTGFGRTGTLFAFEQVDFVPDLLCLGKGITGGMTPFAATIAHTTLYNAFLSQQPDKALMHASTFAGHALGAAVGIASLELFEDSRWQSNVSRIEKQLKQELAPCQGLPAVVDVRALGAIGVVEMAFSLAPVQQHLIEDLLSQGIWCRPFGNIIYTTPSFNIKADQLSHITQAICNSVERIASQWHDQLGRTNG